MNNDNTNLKKESKQARYCKKHTKPYCLRVGKETEKDVYEKLESVDNICGYIKNLIRKDIQEQK